MRSLNRIIWAAAITAIFAGGAAAQTTGTGTGGSTGGTGGGGVSGAGTSGGGPAGNANRTATQQAPPIVAPSEVNTTSAALATSNAFNRYYANPYFQGRAGTTGGSSGANANTPGGFGTALYGATGTTGTTSGTTSGNRSGATARNAGTNTGSTSGIGGTGTAATATGTRTQQGGIQQNTQGGGRNTNSLNQQNNGLTTGRQISYTATLKFAAPSVPVAQMQADLRGMIDASSSIADAKGVSLSVAEGGVIVLKGNAKDEDEANLIEGMIRLTPGVKQVQNELKFPVQ